MNFTLLSLVLASSLTLAPVAVGNQTYDTTAQVRDLSGETSPLKATGFGYYRVTISPEGRSIKCSLVGSLRNVSAKTILYFEAVLKIGSERGGCLDWTYQEDFIFDQNMMYQGSQYDLTENWPTIHSDQPNNFALGEAHADFTVTFVLFADGSYWGKSRSVEDLPAQRRSRIAFMKSLIYAFNEGGGAAVIQSVDDQLANPQISGLQRMLLFETKDKIQKNTLDGLLQEFRQRLATVEQRKSLVDQR